MRLRSVKQTDAGQWHYSRNERSQLHYEWSCRRASQFHAIHPAISLLAGTKLPFIGFGSAGSAVVPTLA